MPIMTNSESLLQFGNNAYGKPATALNILRETVMGRELFDFAFAQYAQKWKFKHPTPADFFRTMEDASAVDLDWFWRGWFFSTDYVDIALSGVKTQKLDAQQPQRDYYNGVVDRHRETITYLRNKKEGRPTVVETDTAARDFYNNTDRNLLDEPADAQTLAWLESLPEGDQKRVENLTMYELTFQNKGGLVMPLVLRFTFEDGTDSIVRIPAEVWLKNEEECQKVFAFEEPVVSIELDPYRELADVDLSNNNWPSKAVPSKFEDYRRRQRSRQNPMQRLNNAK